MSLSLRSLSNGKAHSLASGPSIEIDAGDLFPSYRLLIHGDHILYLNNARLFYVCGMLCWKKGAFIGEVRPCTVGEPSGITNIR